MSDNSGKSSAITKYTVEARRIYAFKTDVNQCPKYIRRSIPREAISFNDMKEITAYDPEFYHVCTKEMKRSVRSPKKQLRDSQESGKLILDTGNQTVPPYNPVGTSLVTREHDGRIDRFQGKDENKATIQKKVTYIPAKDLLRIARALNQRDVKGVMSGIQARINQLKTGKGDKKNVRQQVGQADQVMLKAKQKLRLLKKEQLIEACQKQAMVKAELKKAIQLALLLSEKRSRRRSKEYSQVRNYYPRVQDKSNQEDGSRERSLDYYSDLSSFQFYQPVGDMIQVSSAVSSGGVEGVTISITI